MGLFQFSIAAAILAPVLELPVQANQNLAASSQSLRATTRRPSVVRAGWVQARRVFGGVARSTSTLAPILRDASWASLPPQHGSQGGGIPAAGDVDADGDQDLLIAMPGGGLQVWMNDGLGRFQDESVARLSHPGNVLADIELGDLDGDGDLDLVAATAEALAGFPDRIWLNDGTGVFSSWIDLPAAQVNSSGIALADLDGDGFMDIVISTGQWGHSTVGAADRLYMGHPSGSYVVDNAFLTAPWNESQTASTSVSAADVDLDGDVDLFVTKYDTGVGVGSAGAFNVLLLNDGSGRFSDVSSQMFLPRRRKDNSASGVFADLDSDGDMDLVVANSLLSVSGTQSGDVLWNQGGAQGGSAGTFVDAGGGLEEFPIPAESIRLGQVVGDFNGDGFQDIVFMVHDLPPGGQQPMYAGGPGGTFSRASWFRTSTFIGEAGVAFDADGDGDNELLITAAGSVAGGLDSRRVRFFRNYSR